MFEGTILNSRRMTSSKGNNLQFAQVMIKDEDLNETVVADLMLPYDLEVVPGKSYMFKLGVYNHQFNVQIVRQ